MPPEVPDALAGLGDAIRPASLTWLRNIGVRRDQLVALELGEGAVHAGTVDVAEPQVGELAEALRQADQLVVASVVPGAAGM